jgi:hypothetical protein
LPMRADTLVAPRGVFKPPFVSPMSRLEPSADRGPAPAGQ